MANNNVSMSENKSIVNGLECSPSKSQGTSPYGGKPSIKPGGEATSGSEKTSEFKHSGVPGYSGHMAKGATQE